MGLSLKSIPFKNDLIDKIKKGIDLGHPVLVNTNGRNNFYTWHYKVQDHAHLLLIKGYDENKQLLITHDSDHLGKFLFRDTKYF